VGYACHELPQSLIVSQVFFVGRAVRATSRPPSLPSRPARCAFLLRSRSRHYFPVVALATVLLAHVPSFGRFGAIFSRVKEAPASPL
jgi:hypothetical protein